MITKRELLGQPAVERDHLVVIHLKPGRRVVSHFVVNPRVAVVRLVEVRSVLEEVAEIQNIRAPPCERWEVEVGRLVLLDEDHDAHRSIVCQSQAEPAATALHPGDAARRAG